MASLTHVCMWSDNGWKRITAEQAARLHPGGTVSAHSGLFMCELCGQYVILTDGDIRIRYFKHSAYEKSKDCPERTFGAGYSISYGSQEHDLPIRITSVSSSSFSFEVGLIRAPISSLGKDFCIEIKPKGAFDIPYVYTKERLNYDSNIGERIFEKISTGLCESKALIMIISKDYLKSVCCTDEWGAFYGKALHDKSCVIYPIIIDDSVPPALISQIKYLRFNDDEYTSALSTLLRSLRKQFSK